jgi:hypothetical protein
MTSVDGAVMLNMGIERSVANTLLSWQSTRVRVPLHAQETQNNKLKIRTVDRRVWFPVFNSKLLHPSVNTSYTFVFLLVADVNP